MVSSHILQPHQHSYIGTLSAWASDRGCHCFANIEHRPIGYIPYSIIGGRLRDASVINLFCSEICFVRQDGSASCRLRETEKFGIIIFVILTSVLKERLSDGGKNHTQSATPHREW